MIAMVVSLIILGFLSIIISGFQREFTSQKPRTDALNNAQMALDTAVRVTRMAGAKNPACNSTFVITPLTPSASAGGGVYKSLTVQADWNPPDCVLSGTDENVKFTVNNGILYLDASQSEPFAEGIKEMRFMFYDKTNALISDAVANAGSITYVKIEIETNDDTRTTLSSGVRIRSKQ